MQITPLLKKRLKKKKAKEHAHVNQHTLNNTILGFDRVQHPNLSPAQSQTQYYPRLSETSNSPKPLALSFQSEPPLDLCASH